MSQENNGLYTETGQLESADNKLPDQFDLVTDADADAEEFLEWEEDAGDDLDELLAGKEAALNKRDILFRRWVAFIIDSFWLFFVQILFLGLVVPTMTAAVVSCTQSGKDIELFEPLFVNLLEISCVLVYLLRDMFGTSPGKRIMKLALVTDSGEKPVRWRRVLRNALLFIWPVEGLVLLVSGKRILDNTLGLDVVIKDAKE